MQYGNTNRFRPTYWILYLGECSLWGNNPTAWYLFRMGIFIFMLFVAMYLLDKWVGWMMAVGITMLTLLWPGWSDIWTRLGPAEVYGVLGSTVVMLSIYAISVSKGRFWGYFGLLAGGIVVLGAKENFVIWLLPIWLLYFYLILKKRNDKFLLIVALILTGFGFWIWWGLIKFFSVTNTDVYGSSVESASRLSCLVSWGVRIYKKIPMVIKIISGIFLSISMVANIYLFASLKKKRKEWMEVLGLLFIIVVFSVIVVGSQVFFYNGSWPMLSRYDYPGILTLPLLLATIFYVGKKLIEILNGGRRQWVYTGVWLVAMLAVIRIVGYGTIIEASKSNAIRTRLFTDRIQKIVDQASNNRDKVLLFESDDPGDYEPVFSIRWFLISYGVKNRFEFKWRGYKAEEYSSVLDKELANSLIEISKNGGEGFYPVKVNDKKKCLTVSFMDETTKVGCDQVLK